MRFPAARGVVGDGENSQLRRSARAALGRRWLGVLSNDHLAALPADAPERRTAIRLLHAGDRLFSRVYHHLTVIRPCPIPRVGPAIVVCNHISPMDPVFVQAVSDRRLIHWMMASEYMKISALNWVFRTIGIIPVARSGRDSGPLRAALRTLEQGRVLGIFPEGRIETTRQLLPFQTGVALMAIKAGVPIYPAYVDGTQRGQEMLAACLSPNDAVLAFGKPVDVSGFGTSKEELAEATAVIRNAVDELRREMERNRFGRELERRTSASI